MEIRTYFALVRRKINTSAFRVVASISGLAVLVNCGPLNKKPADQVSALMAKQGALAGDPTLMPKFAISDKELFLMTTKAVAGSAQKPQVGDNGQGAYNVYHVSIARPEGFKHPDKGSLTVDYHRDHATVTRIYNATVTPLPDGTYNVTFIFKKTGVYDLFFHFNDGEDHDDFELAVSL